MAPGKTVSEVVEKKCSNDVKSLDLLPCNFATDALQHHQCTGLQIIFSLELEIFKSSGELSFIICFVWE